MRDKFGQFEWHCWKDERPRKDSWIYIYYADIPDGNVQIANESDSDLGLSSFFDDFTYWCYIFMPDKPKIEEKLSLEYRIEKLEKANQFIFEHLQKRAYEINDKLKEAYDKKVSELLGDED